MKIAVPAVLFLAVLALPALADLPEPPMNTGATSVEVEGTKVKAEAWAVALGHDVEAVVVVRFIPKEGAEPTVEAYERWSVDGHNKLERGSRKLGREWEKKLWKLVEEAEKELSAEERKALPRKKEDLLERLGRSLGKSGSRPVGGSVLAWSVTSARSERNGRLTTARTAIVTFSAPGPVDAVTPGEDPSSGGRGPVTPGDGASPRNGRPSRPFGSGSGSASASGSSRTVADSDRGIRQHDVVEADLQHSGARPPADEPRGEVTPSEK